MFTETEAHVVLAVESSQDNKVQLKRPVIGGNPPKTDQEGSIDESVSRWREQTKQNKCLGVLYEA